MTPTISFLVTVHNEAKELQILLDKLLPILKAHPEQMELVILDDFSTDSSTRNLLDNVQRQNVNVRCVQHALGGDFGAHKTYGSRRCEGDFIVQLDADEYLPNPIQNNLLEIFEANPHVDLFRLPRVNIVRGCTVEDARKWGWSVTTLPQFGDLPIINWVNNGDYQSRIYLNHPDIYWAKPLHETIVGAKTICTLPLEVDYAIIHDKTIDRQRAQNEFYNHNWSVKANQGQG